MSPQNLVPPIRVELDMSTIQARQYMLRTPLHNPVNICLPLVYQLLFTILVNLLRLQYYLLPHPIPLIRILPLDKLHHLPIRTSFINPIHNFYFLAPRPHVSPYLYPLSYLYYRPKSFSNRNSF